MTDIEKKREAIRKGMAKDYLFPWVHSTGANWSKMSEAVKFGYCKRAEQIIKYLHSQGAVLKVEGELPEMLPPTKKDEETAHCGQWSDKDWYYAGQSKAYEKMLDAGYHKTAPLIEEKGGEACE